MNDSNFKYFVVIGDKKQISNACDMVDDFMSEKMGSNVIFYKLYGVYFPHWYDTGHITDEALEELKKNYNVVEYDQVY